MSRPKPPTYRTTNWHDYNAALARRGSLAIGFDPETQWLAAPTGKRGRQPVFTDAAIQACLKLLGERVMSRDFDRQVAGLQIRAAILNRFTALGTPLTLRTG